MPCPHQTYTSGLVHVHQDLFDVKYRFFNVMSSDHNIGYSGKSLDSGCLSMLPRRVKCIQGHFKKDDQLKCLPTGKPLIIVFFLLLATFWFCWCLIWRGYLPFLTSFYIGKVKKNHRESNEILFLMTNRNQVLGTNSFLKLSNIAYSIYRYASHSIVEVGKGWASNTTITD